jgi:hypothetical protein
MKPRRNKISYDTGNPYNKRWKYKWRHAYYTYPRDGFEHTRVMRPEETRTSTYLFEAWAQDFLQRSLPGLKTWWDRRHRMFDPFSVYALPGTSLLFYQVSDINFGFKVREMSFRVHVGRS